MFLWSHWVLVAATLILSSKPDEAMGRISVKNGGPSRSGEKRKTPKTKESQNRYAGSRQKEWDKRTLNRKVANVKLSKEGLYICQKCRKVKPEEDFPQHVPTSGKFSGAQRCV